MDREAFVVVRLKGGGEALKTLSIWIEKDNDIWLETGDFNTSLEIEVMSVSFIPKPSSLM